MIGMEVSNDNPVDPPLTDAPVNGYWVVFSYQGKEYDYRGNAGGYFRRCPVPTFPSRSGPKM